MTYRDLLARLYGTRRFGVRFELERVRRVLARLGDPGAAIGRVAQIGGTNGKGSTAAFTESLLRTAGLRTGVFTSPHLSRFTERFRVDGEPVGEGELVWAGQEVFEAAGDDLALTFFEQATAMALVVFARAGIDAAVLEVGMGGRLDATTAVAADVTAVTGVALDHEQYLGDSLESIAREKAGIFRPGVPAVIGRSGEAEAVEWLLAMARDAGAVPIAAADAPPFPCELGIPGAHQRANAACALAVVEQLVSLDDRARARALAEARCPGRMETVATDPLTVVDGAHNPHGARAVAAQVRPDACVVGVSHGKAIDAVVAALVAGARWVFATQASSDRAAPAAEIAAAAARANPGARVVVEPSARRAIERARESSDGPVLVAGSLFLAGEARQLLCGEPADPVVLTDPVGKLPR